MKFKTFNSKVDQFLFYVKFFNDCGAANTRSKIEYLTFKHKIKIDKYNLNTIDEI